jgi:hypothetical protein
MPYGDGGMMTSAILLGTSIAVLLVRSAAVDETMSKDSMSTVELRYGIGEHHDTTWASDEDYAAALAAQQGARQPGLKMLTAGLVDDKQRALLRSEQRQKDVQQKVQANQSTAKGEHHLSLRQMTECKGVNRKALKLVIRHMHAMMEKGAEIPKVEKELIGKLTLGSFGEEAIDDLSDMIQLVSLHFAITHGVVWTLEDQQSFTQCNANRPQLRLEENTRTRRGELLVQGDMVALPKHATTQLWPSGALTYCFADGIHDRAITAFRNATAHFKKQIPCLDFHEVEIDPVDPLSCTRKAAVRITSDEDGCWSHVGYVNSGLNGPSQQLNLGLGCRTMGMASHQLAQALGMVHQTARNDRDSYLHILWKNIDASNDSAKVLFANNDGLFHGTDFDYFSVTNFPPFAFSSSNPTILAKLDVRLSGFLGQRMGLSQNDAERIGEVYGCDTIHPATPSKKLTELVNKGEAYDNGTNCINSDYLGFVVEGQMPDCMDLAGKNLCNHGEHKAAIVQKCPRACMRCLIGFQDIGLHPGNVIPKLTPKAPPRFRRPITWTEEMGYYPMSNRTTLLLKNESANASVNASFLELSLAGAGPNDAVAASGNATTNMTATQDSPEVHLRFGESNNEVTLCEDGELHFYDKYLHIEATCHEMRFYCNDETLGEKISATCPKSCGKCALELVVENTTGCADKPKDEAPIYYDIAGHVAECRVLQDKCRADPGVAAKCRYTCQNCGDHLELLGPMHGSANASLLNLTGDQVESHEVEEPMNHSEKHSEAVDHLREELSSGCARRRRFGFCGKPNLSQIDYD